ncbi:hypothetical protein E4U42_000336 [Claviceps africana]|uniref:Uncharacterized protein n=1 Tax=Claviceps africana TaxID=83212 RepID=A0A8K0NIH5_9HYPO|nr:hypothetical protein E4U42_000336 [Claviceps africana]
MTLLSGVVTQESQQHSREKDKDKMSDVCPEETSQKTDEIFDDGEDLFRQLRKNMDTNFTRVCEKFKKICLEQETKLKERTLEADILKEELKTLKKLFQQEKETLNAKLAAQPPQFQQLGPYETKPAQATAAPKSEAEFKKEIERRISNLRDLTKRIASAADQFVSYPECVNPFFELRYKKYTPVDRVSLIRETIYKIIHDCTLGDNKFRLVNSGFRNKRIFSPPISSDRENQALQIQKGLNYFEDYFKKKGGTKF